MSSPKIFLMYSPQGGSGKTTLALYTSIKSALLGKKTLLVDMSAFGSIYSHLKLNVDQTEGLSDVLSIMKLEQFEGTFEEVIDSSLHETHIQNLRVLISANPIKVEGMKESQVLKILDTLSEMNFETIIIDTSSELSEKNVVLFERVSKIVVPVTQDIHCGWRLMQFKEVLNKCGIEDSKVGLVVNRCCKTNAFNNLEYVKEIGYQVIGEVKEYRRRFQNQINEGKSLMRIKNRKAIKEFEETAENILVSAR